MEHAKSNLYFNSATVELWFRGLIYQPRRLWWGSAAQVVCFAVCVSRHTPSCGCPWLLDKWIYEGKTLLEEDSAFSVDPEGILKVAFPSKAGMSTLRSRLFFSASASLQGKAVDLKMLVPEEAPYGIRALCLPSLPSRRSAGRGRVPTMRRLLARSALGKLLRRCVLVSHTRGDRAADSASEQSSSAYWRVRGKTPPARPPFSDFRMNSLMECWTRISDLSCLPGVPPVTECVSILINKALRT